MVFWIVFAIVLCSWCIHLLRNGYVIILPGLRVLFVIFVTHLGYLYVQFFMTFARPAWSADQSAIYWKYPVLCHVYGRLSSFLGMASLIFSTLFGFCKIRVYAQISDKPEELTIQMSFLQFTIAIWIASCIVAVVMTGTGKIMVDDVRLCFEYPPAWSIFTVTVLWFVINCYIIYVCFKYRNLRHVAIPNLQHQMLLNIYIIPAIFFSTLFLRLVGIWYDSTNPTNADLKNFLRVMPPCVDNLLNSYVMYWFLYGKSQSRFLRRSTQSASPLEDAPYRWSQSRSRSLSDMGNRWVTFYGFHPVRMNNETIESHNLQHMIIPDEVRERQIVLYQSRWCHSTSVSDEVPLDFSRTPSTTGPTFDPHILME